LYWGVRGGEKRGIASQRFKKLPTAFEIKPEPLSATTAERRAIYRSRHSAA
jgi:hypothetical protein